MVAYPTDYSPFTQKLDQIDVVLAEHVNSLQAELEVLQRVLGLNPQGQAATVAARIASLENGGVNTTDNQTIGGDKIFTGTTTFTAPVRIIPPGVLDGLDDGDHPLQIGPTAGKNMMLDGQAVQTRNAGVASPLNLNPYGGEVRAGANRVLTTADTGPTGGLNVDKVDGYDASAFAAADHKHPQNFVQLYRSTGQAVPAGTDETDWHDVIFTNQTVHYKESGSDMYVMANGRFYTPPAVGPALYYFGVRLAFQKTTNVGTRRMRFIDSNGVIFDMMAEEADLMAKDFISLSGMYYFPGTSNYWVKAQVYQDSGQTVSIYAHSTSRPFSATWAAVMRGLS